MTQSDISALDLCKFSGMEVGVLIVATYRIPLEDGIHDICVDIRSPQEYGVMISVAGAVIAGNGAVVDIQCLSGRSGGSIKNPCHAAASACRVAGNSAVDEIILEILLHGIFGHEYTTVIFGSFIVEDIAVAECEMLTFDTSGSNLEYTRLIVGGFISYEYTIIGIEIGVGNRDGTSTGIIVGFGAVLGSLISLEKGVGDVEAV